MSVRARPATLWLVLILGGLVVGAVAVALGSDPAHVAADVAGTLIAIALCLLALRYLRPGTPTPAAGTAARTGEVARRRVALIIVLVGLAAVPLAIAGVLSAWTAAVSAVVLVAFGALELARSRERPMDAA
jgi:hypothetical protein